jgi:hypothetical protein
MPINVLWMGESGSKYIGFLETRGYKVHVPQSIEQTIEFLRNPPRGGFSGYVTELDLSMGKDYREAEDLPRYPESGEEEDDPFDKNTDFLEHWKNDLISGVSDYDPKIVGVVVHELDEFYVDGVGLISILEDYGVPHENIVDDEILKNNLQLSIFVGKICQIG